MRTSKEITELLKKCMLNIDGVEFVYLHWDFDIWFRASGVDSLLAKMHDLSLGYVVGCMATYCPVGKSPYLKIYLLPSTNGQTNIDAEFMEELAKLNIISSENGRIMK